MTLFSKTGVPLAFKGLQTVREIVNRVFDERIYRRTGFGIRASDAVD